MTTITFTESSTADAIDVRWGSDYMAQTFHVKLHPSNTRSSKAPWLLYIHGGGGTSNHAMLPFVANGNMNFVFAGVLGKTAPQEPHFNVVSVNIPQLEYALNDSTYPIVPVDTLTNAQGEGATLDPIFPRSQEELSSPLLWTLVQLFICHFKSVAAEYGCNPDMGFGMGSSFGGIRMLASQINEPLDTDTLPARMLRAYGLKPGVDSRLKGLITQYGQVDLRRDPDYVVASGAAANTYVIQPHLIARMVGCRTKTQMDALSAGFYNELSLLWHMQEGKTQYIPPMYQMWERNGISGGGTNGTTSYPLPDAAAHDEQQLFNLVTYAKKYGLGHLIRYSLILPADTADGEAKQATLFDDIWEWLNGIISPGAEYPPLSGKGAVYWSTDVGQQVPAGYGS